jgi:carbonic anhydrase
MDFLEKGVLKFKRVAFHRNQAEFRKLARAQSPRVLFITCADSRVVPALITQTGPGDLFVERNPGNIVPIYVRRPVGVSASIEYAVDILKVEHVVVCGHSDCGAVYGILHPDQLRAAPAVKRWLSFGKRARQRLLRRGRGPSEQQRQLELLTQLNVQVQIEHLQTHPSVARRLRRGDLKLHGWVYRIHDGEILQMDPRTGDFLPWPW